MKGDMAGAAAVVGLMHTLAARKAKANVIGAIGLVENMPDGNAQRPGDIVTSMSGQTIEIINTDAEGRLVLADVLWHVKQKYNPKFMVNLATLTGAIMVALGQDHAGLFSNNDDLCDQPAQGRHSDRRKAVAHAARAGIRQDHRFQVCRCEEFRWSLWRGHHGRAIPAALCGWLPLGPSRYCRHGHVIPVHRYQQELGSGFGVRLLDRLVAENYEG